MGEVSRMKSNLLSAKRVANLLRAGEPGRHLDGGGLYLEITGPGAGNWQRRYEIDRRERWHGLGPAALFSLAQSRKRNQAISLLLVDGIDPIEQKRATRDAARQAAADRLSFRDAAKQFLDVHSDGWKNAKHRTQWETTLRKYAFPLLGDRPYREIDAARINEAIAPLWAKAPETASRVRQRINRVIQWVKDGRPLPAPKEHHKSRQPALPFVQMFAFLEELRAREGVAARALEFAIHTAARTDEVIGAVWDDEINLDAKVWTIPGRRMKGGKEHRVPLSDRAIEILRALPVEDGNSFVFIGAKTGQSLSPMALLKVVQGMNESRTQRGLPRWVDPKQNNRDVVPHGFRSSFRDWVGETTSFPADLAEAALAHKIKNAVQAAYERGDKLERRRKLMQAWSQYCGSAPATTGTVVPLRPAS
jgi:integrase